MCFAQNKQEDWVGSDGAQGARNCLGNIGLICPVFVEKSQHTFRSTSKHYSYYLEQEKSYGTMSDISTKTGLFVLCCCHMGLGNRKIS